MADRNLAGEPWEVRRGDRVVLTGRFDESVVGPGPHTPRPFNFRVDVSALRQDGNYSFHAPGAEPAFLSVHPQPYARFIDQALHFLRMARSGTAEVPPGRRASHLGDAHAPVWLPDGDPSNGRWRAADPARTVDVRGGWYDAGDQIKFTLNEAYTTYVLLLSYRWQPQLFPRAGDGALPPLLVEAKHGLEYLAKLHPAPDTFIIQVGDERDHDQPPRLPEDDAMDGQRPALSALSRVHLASAAAALAAGAQVFSGETEAPDAEAWGRLARQLYQRAREPDTVRTAFERGQVNDFYHDPSEEDQLALAALELFQLTGERRFLDEAREYAPAPAPEVSWSNWHAHANAALAPHDPAALDRLQQETGQYVAHAVKSGQPWQIPGRLVWASLHRWIGAAHAAQRAALLSGGDATRSTLFDAMVDYTFGRNNWGVSFVFTRDLPNTVRHIYSPLYRLLDQFPTGALSEGPGNRSTYETLMKYFDDARSSGRLPHRPELDRFNTAAAVFFDDAANFMTQEATICGQADLILLLTLASMEPTAAP